MNLKDFDIVPGVIINVDDPLKLGRVQCAAPGLFDPSVMDADVIPWCMPMQMNKYQMFSKPMKNAKVWIYNNKKNYNEFWYTNMFEMIDVTKQIVDEKYDHDLELIMSRKTVDGCVQISYDDIDGIRLKINEDCINLRPNGDIQCHGAGGEMNIIGGHVYTGNEDGEYEPMVLGNKLVEILAEMSKQFDVLYNSCMSGELAPLRSGFMKLKCLTAESNSQKVKAKNSSVN